LLEAAIFSLKNDDPESASLQVGRAISIADGYGAELLGNAGAQLNSGDNAGALATLEILAEQWPLGDPVLGAETFASSCANCHGAEGEGLGVFPQLNPNEFVQSLSNAELVTFVQEGRVGTAMAGFEGRLTETEIANVIAFLRTWQP
jgi:mono/diheme cytochrome c family protein